jgi:hypothetical protein
MTVSNPAYLQSLYNTTRSMGDKAISSDAAFEIEGFEQMWLLTKQFPWPELSSAGEIEIPMPLGAAKWEPQQVKINQQGQITLMETKIGHVSKMMLNLIPGSPHHRIRAFLARTTCIPRAILSRSTRR